MPAAHGPLRAVADDGEGLSTPNGGSLCESARQVSVVLLINGVEGAQPKASLAG